MVPCFLSTGTKLETHSEYLTGKMITSFKSFSNSFQTIASNAGLIGLCFFLYSFILISNTLILFSFPNTTSINTNDYEYSTQIESVTEESYINVPEYVYSH